MPPNVAVKSTFAGTVRHFDLNLQHTIVINVALSHEDFATCSPSNTRGTILSAISFGPLACPFLSIRHSLFVSLSRIISRRISRRCAFFHVAIVVRYIALCTLAKFGPEVQQWIVRASLVTHCGKSIYQR